MDYSELLVWPKAAFVMISAALAGKPKQPALLIPPAAAIALAVIAFRETQGGDVIKALAGYAGGAAGLLIGIQLLPASDR